MSTLWKNNNSITSDSGPCPSLTEHEYKPRFFNKPDCLSSNKENIPPIESVTPPSLRNLSLEEEANESENKATSWEANVARNLETMPKASSPYLRKMSTLEDLELDTDNDMIDVSDFFERPSNDKRSPRPKQTTMTHWINSRTLPHTSKQSHIHTNEHRNSSSTCQAPQNQDPGDPPRQKNCTPWMPGMSKKTATQGSI